MYNKPPYRQVFEIRYPEYWKRTAFTENDLSRKLKKSYFCLLLMISVVKITGLKHQKIDSG